MMKRSIDSKQYQQALDLFQQQSAHRTNTSIHMAIKACTTLKDYQRGTDIIKHLSLSSLNNHFIQTSIIGFYMQCNDVDNADRVFSTIVNKSNFTYTVMFKGYLLNKMPEKVLDSLDGMTIHPDAFTLSMIFKACGQVKDERAKRVGLGLLRQIPDDFRSDTVLQNCALFMLMKFHEVGKAEDLFSSMKRKDTISYGAMMEGYMENAMAEKALNLFEMMSVNADDGISIIIFKACAQVADERAQRLGRKLLNKMSTTLSRNAVLTDSAVHMLMRFGDTKNAEQLFDSLKNKNVISYGAMMQEYIANDRSDKALDLFEGMTVEANSIIHTLLFKACALLVDARAKSFGRELLDQALKKYPTDSVLWNSAIRMLMQFGDVENAERIFETMKDKNVATYGAMIQGYIVTDRPEKALNLFEEMPVAPNNFIYTMVFKVCALLANDKTIHLGKKLLDQPSNNFETNTVLSNSAIHMLMRFGDTTGAERLFNVIQSRCVVSYGAMMHGYLENNMAEKALDLFETMSVDANDGIAMIVFKGCAQLANERAQRLGGTLLNEISTELSNNALLTDAAVHMLMSFGDTKNAEKLFNSLKNKNVISYGAMMQDYVANDRPDQALDLYERMTVPPNSFIHATVFKVYALLANEKSIHLGKKLLDELSNNFETNTILSNSAINMLMRFGDTTDAERLFNMMKNRSVVSYGAMMHGYLQNDMPHKALDLFDKMSVKPDNIIYTIAFDTCAETVNERSKQLGNKLLQEISTKKVADRNMLGSAMHMLMRFGEFERAENLFQSIKDKDVSTYASMMKAYNLNEQPLKTIRLFQTIKLQGLLPDAVTSILSLNACSQIGILAVCQFVVDQIPPNLLSNQRIVNVLINMWGKAGSVEKAREVFEKLNDPPTFMRNSLINACGLNGRGAEAVDIFQQIPNHLRDEVSYVCTLNACSHSGLLNEARMIYQQITVKTKRIITAMIDCLSRLFLFDEAEMILNQYETHNSPFLPMYMTIMSGARNHRDPVRSQKLYNRMMTLFPHEKNDLISASILLSNTYSSLGHDQQAAAVQSHRRTHYGKKVKPGMTWTEKDGEIAEFRAHDHSHPSSKEIHHELKLIAEQLKEYGHRFNAMWITRRLGEDETNESVLCGHSEKLAIAYHFIRGRRPSFIQCTKNLRVCGDCHEATKLIAKIRQCDIVVRDANRMHHFSRNGTCSCGDHF